MGIVSQLFVARPRDLSSRDPLDEGASYFPAIEVSGITPEVLADLEAAVTAKSRPKLSEEVAGEEGGPWLNVLSDRFVKRLADLGSDECEELSNKWLGKKGRRPIPLVADLAALCRIATRANATGRHKAKSPEAWRVYLWTSL